MGFGFVKAFHVMFSYRNKYQQYGKNSGMILVGDFLRGLIFKGFGIFVVDWKGFRFGFGVRSLGDWNIFKGYWD